MWLLSCVYFGLWAFKPNRFRFGDCRLACRFLSSARSFKIFQNPKWNREMPPSYFLARYFFCRARRLIDFLRSVLKKSAYLQSLGLGGQYRSLIKWCEQNAKLFFSKKNFAKFLFEYLFRKKIKSASKLAKSCHGDKMDFSIKRICY